MFTGLIETTGTVERLAKIGAGASSSAMGSSVKLSTTAARSMRCPSMARNSTEPAAISRKLVTTTIRVWAVNLRRTPRAIAATCSAEAPG